LTASDTRVHVSGHYAGASSRAAATIIDIGIVFGLYTVGVAGLDLLFRVVLGTELSNDRGLAWGIALAAWAFLYAYISLAVAGRTIGKGLIGLRVVTTGGGTLPGSRALGRTAAFPLSCLLFGLGFLGILIGRRHRALHDVIAGTCVVYDWGDRPAELPAPISAFLARKAGAEYTPGPPPGS
jgi:uncharacterized RDD family membrane protein YckC